MQGQWERKKKHTNSAKNPAVLTSYKVLRLDVAIGRNLKWSKKNSFGGAHKTFGR